ncbi:hypothetical protein [Gorillibacterium sp. sgz500922]|uniref:hypothetical protein n=1 Tax=Gorillibacterium sp. sgz500922 TaxID=3446694 RepID=UPI003F66B95C
MNLPIPFEQLVDRFEEKGCSDVRLDNGRIANISVFKQKGAVYFTAPSDKGMVTLTPDGEESSVTRKD